MLDDPEISPVVRFSQSRRLKMFFIPGCFLLSWGLEPLGFFRWIAFGFRHWFHEVGHSLFAWFSGRASIPLLGFAPISDQKSWFTYLCFLFLIGYVAYAGYKIRSFYMVGLSVLFFLAQTFYTFFATHSFWTMSMIWAGVGCEMIIASFFISAFAHPIPEKTYWTLLKFIVVPWSTLSFWVSFSTWWRISRSEELISWGSLWGGPEHQGGDMNRLRDEFAFSPDEIATIYVTTGLIAVAFIAANYIWTTWFAPAAKRAQTEYGVKSTTSIS